MSFYKKLITAIAVMGFASAVIAADDNASVNAADNSATSVSAPAENAAATSTTTTTTDKTTTTTTSSKVNINKATVKQLAKVKGLNQAKARAIVSYRKKHGEFKSLDDLKNVKGFKKCKATKLSDIEGHLSVE